MPKSNEDVNVGTGFDPFQFPTPPGPPPEITVQWVYATPDWADAVLDLYDVSEFKNRTKDNVWVEILSNEMSLGMYKHTHQGLAFDPTGVLFDGQHRLKAVVLSGIPQWILVSVYGSQEVAQDALRVIDRHRRRRVGQTVSMMGNSNGKIRASVARFILKVVRDTNRVNDGMVYQLIEASMDAFTEVKDILKKESLGIASAPQLSALICIHTIYPKALSMSITGISKNANGCQQALIKLLKQRLKATEKKEVFIRVLWVMHNLMAGRCDSPKPLQGKKKEEILKDTFDNLVLHWPDLTF